MPDALPYSFEPAGPKSERCDEITLTPAEPAAAQAATKEDDEPDFDFKAARKLQQQLRALNFGLRLHYWKYLCVALSILLFLTGILLSTMVELLGLLCMLLSFGFGIAAPVLGITGSVQCNARILPAEARSVIVTSLGFDAVSLGLAVIGAAAMLLAPLGGLILLAGSALLNLAAFSLFMMFLRRLALYLGEQVLAQRGRDTMVTFLGVTLGGFAVMALMLTPIVLFIPFATPLAAFMLDLVWIVLVIQMLFQILHVIAGVREAIARR